MSYLRFILTRLVVLMLTLFSLGGITPMDGQNLRFAAPMYGVGAVNTNAVANTVLSNPQGIAVDVAGNLYIADSGNRIVRKVDPTETATIFAGTGQSGNTGDGSAAIAAKMTSPNSVAVDLAGNLYIADTSNFVVRKVDASGNISTFAGGNGTGSSGNGGAAAAAKMIPAYVAVDNSGNVYIADTSSNTVRVVNTTTNIINLYAGGGTPASGNGDGGPATSAKFTPTAIALDKAGNLYIADSTAHNVRMVTPQGAISSFAGTGVYGSSGDNGPATSAQLISPVGLAADSAGDVYIADAGARRIRMVNSSGVISTVVGTGVASPYPLDGLPADAARIDSPRGLAVDPAGNYLYFTVSSWNFAYQVVLHPEQFPMTRVGNTSQPQRLILENYGNTDINLTSINFTGDFALAANYSPQPYPCRTTIPVYSGFNGFCTMDIVFAPTAEGIRSFALTLQTSDTPSTISKTLTSTGLGSALALSSGQMFIVAGKHGGTAGYRGDNGPAVQASLNGVNGMAVDSSGNLYLAEYPYCQVRKVDGNTGIITTIAGANPAQCDNLQISGDGGSATSAILQSPGPMAIDAHNNLYISDGFDARIRKISLTDGTISAVAGTGISLSANISCGYSGDGHPATQAALCGPSGIAFDTLGNLYFADGGNNVIRKIDTSGIITTIAGVQGSGSYSGDGGPALSAHFNTPMGVAVNAAGDIFISDHNNHVIRKIDHVTNIITTIAGQPGVTGYGGDGGLATSAKLNYPEGIAVDAAGNIFVADYYNMVIRKVDPSGIITTVAGNNFIYDGYNGDDLPATATALAFPAGVAVSPSGYLFINDQSNQVVRELTPNGVLDFGSVQVHTTSTARTVTMQNVGNMPLNFDSQFPTGITGDFAVTNGGNCDFTAPLAVGATCSVNLTFTPTASGPRAGIFGFFNDGVTSPQYVALSGTGTAPSSQTITFSPIPNHAYGDTAFNLTATATSGLPVSFSVVSGNATVSGSAVTITGVGSVTIAANQAGDSTWPAASQVTQSFTIAPATLTVKAADQSGATGQPIVPLTYSISGFVYNDTQSVVSGTAAISTTATASSPSGTYPIAVSAGTLAATNYSFNFVNGSYVIGQARQVINFQPLPDRTYGDASFTLSATASSSLPVSFSILSGPATLSGNTVSLTGVGTVVVQATQAGDSSYSAASPVSRSFNVVPATLTVTAQNATSSYGQALPSFTAAISGYVYSDTATVVSGAPAISTTATTSSGAGSYPIVPAQGTLTASNYVFTFVNGSLTITPASLSVLVTGAQRPYGAANPTFTGEVGGLRNGDQVTVTYTTTATPSSPIGAYPITAAVSGASAANYTPQVTPGLLAVTKADTATALTSSTSQVNAGSGVTLTATVSPVTTGTPTGTVTFLDGQTQLGSSTLSSGVATLTLNTLNGGVHPLTAVYVGDTNFNGSTSSLVRVVAGDYTLTANPSTVNIKQGQSGTATVTVTPTNGYKGTITLSCTNLPVGVACNFSPASVTADGSNTPLTMQLSITTTAPRAVTTTAASTVPLAEKRTPFLKLLTAMAFCIPLVLVVPGDKKKLRVTIFTLMFLALGLSGCGSSGTQQSSTPQNGTPIGASTITISVDSSHKLDLTVNVQ